MCSVNLSIPLKNVPVPVPVIVYVLSERNGRVGEGYGVGVPFF